MIEATGDDASGDSSSDSEEFNADDITDNDEHDEWKPPSHSDQGGWPCECVEICAIIIYI